MKNRRLLLLLLVSVLILGIGVGGVLWFRSRDKTTPGAAGTSEQTKSDGTTQKQPEKIRLIAVGDMLPHETINERAETSGGSWDYKPFMSGMKQYFESADIRFCNQAVLGAGKDFGITGYPVFNSPTEFSRDMQATGCNLINTGTNHTNDKGQKAIDASVSVWDGLPGILATAGANRSAEEMNKVRYFEVRGVKFAFLSYTTYTNINGQTTYGLTMYSDALAQKQINEARSNADVVIVSMRWGTEYSPDINIGQDSLGQKLADLGADIVIGHGSHVLEPVKKLSGQGGRETIVWYSVGNFLNAQLETEALIGGFAVMDIDPKTKKVEITGFLPTYMHYEWTAEQKAQEDLLARKNLNMYLLEEAAEPMRRSQLGTTVEAQKNRITEVLKRYSDVPILTKTEYLSRP